MARKDIRSAARATGAGLAMAVLALLGGGCRQDMRDNARLKPFERSPFFANGSSARLPVANTIARGHLVLDDAWFTGKSNGQFVAKAPVAVTLAELQRGQDRFQIFCTPCHDRTGSGTGMIVRRGFKQPRSYHDPALRAQPDGYFFDVMTRGFANMPDYATQVPVADRWAIVTYIRALQLSQSASTNQMTAADLAQLTRPAAPAAAAATAPEAGGHP